MAQVFWPHSSLNMNECWLAQTYMHHVCTELLCVYVYTVLYGIVCIFWNVLVCTLYNWSYLLDPVSVLHI